MTDIPTDTIPALLLRIGQRLGLRITTEREAPAVVSALLQDCWWTNIDIVTDWAIDETWRQLLRGELPALTPFALQAIPCSPELRHAVARRWALEFERRILHIREFEQAERPVAWAYWMR